MKSLDEIKIEWHDKKSLCIVLCSKGYPDEIKKKVLINDINKVKFDKNRILLSCRDHYLQRRYLCYWRKSFKFCLLSDNFLAG